MKKKTNGQKLKELRKTLGLTQQELAQQAEVSPSTLGRCENNHTDLPPKLQEWIAKIKGKHKSFIQGKRYRIYSKGYFGGDRDNSTFTGTSWDRDCIFQYLKKQGNHHLFREIHGHWTRTYTDAQLIGKHIEEVKT